MTAAEDEYEQKKRNTGRNEENHDSQEVPHRYYFAYSYLKLHLPGRLAQDMPGCGGHLANSPR